VRSFGFDAGAFTGALLLEFEGRQAVKHDKQRCKRVRCSNEDARRRSNLSMGATIMIMQSGKAECKAGRCADSAFVVLQSKNYCLNHFITRCYDRLEMLEPLIRAGALQSAESAAARAFLQECSNRVVVVCFRNDDLSISDRPRLLQILLWSEELQRLLRRPGAEQAAQRAHYLG